MVDILGLVGILSFLLGVFLLIVETFKVSIVWGVWCFILIPGYFIFMFLKWDESKRPIQIQFTGIALALIASVFR